MAKELYKVTGDKKYADYYETTLRNSIMGAVKSESGAAAYFIPMATGYFKTFGNEDPAVTGMVLAVLGMTIPFHKNKIEAAPLFDDENVLEGEILLKGRIYGIVVLKTAAELYFNKNIKYVIHRWRHKEVKHGERE